MKFSLLYKFSFLPYFSLKIAIFSWVVEFLENILAFSLKQDYSVVYSQQSLAKERLLYPWYRREKPYKIWFVCPSFRLPISFLGIGSLVFCENYYNVRGPYIVVCDSWILWKKSPPGKNCQKWPKNMVFELFKKITSLVLSGFCVQSKFSWFINILRKLHAWEKSSSQVKAKVALS